MDNWYKKAFSKDYIRLYKHRNSDEAETSIDQLLTHIILPKDAVCLDLCCGFGRHLAYLNKNGVQTFGLDLSADLLEHASHSNYTRNRLIQADMRKLPFKGCFDFVFSFFSSFGYFSKDEENLNVLLQISNILKPKGGFMIDFLNAEKVKQNLIPEDRKEFPGHTVIQRRWINQKNNSVEKEITINDSKGSHRFQESVKLYRMEDFTRFCSQCGLSIVKVLGNYNGEPYHAQSERLILIGEKCES